MSPAGDRATLGAWGGHRYLQGLSAVADYIPSEASLLDVKTLPSTHPRVHWESSFGMSEVRRLGGTQEVKSSVMEGTGNSL